MCLINFHFHKHPKYKLIVAANRDEIYDRPTAPAHFWEDIPEIVAGRDLLQMGTWLGITKQGRFAALTNFRDPAEFQSAKTSRGLLVRQYLEEQTSPENFLQSLKQEKDQYAGFNLLFGSPDQLFHYSNIENKGTEITPGAHGLSNHLLNTPWPKVTKGKERLNAYVMSENNIDENELFKIISDTEKAEDHLLPNTGVGLEFERTLSPLFIQSSNYGTRSSTVLYVDYENHVTFVERTYNQGVFASEQRYTFTMA